MPARVPRRIDRTTDGAIACTAHLRPGRDAVVWSGALLAWYCLLDAASPDTKVLCVTANRLSAHAVATSVW